jgi:hypothetical protein
MVFRAKYLTCSCGGPRFQARHADGKRALGAATVRRILEAGVPQQCPHCKKIVNQK